MDPILETVTQELVIEPITPTKKNVDDFFSAFDDLMENPMPINNPFVRPQDGEVCESCSG